MDQLGVAGLAEQRVALAHRLPEPCADRQDQIRLPHPGDQGGIGADAQIAHGIVERAVIERLPPERDRNRQVMRHEEAADRRAPGLRPTAAAQDRQRLLGRAQHAGERLHRRRIGLRQRDRGARDVGDLDHVLLHFLGQRDHHRAGAAGHGDVHGVGDDLRDAACVVDLRHPFRQRAEHPAVIDFLEAFAVGLGEGDLADEQQHRRAVLLGDVDADGAVAGARAACDHGRGAASGELAVGLGRVHRAGFEAAGDQAELIMHGIQPVQDVEIALAGDAEDVIDALRHQSIRQHTAPSAGLGLRLRHAILPTARRRIGASLPGVTLAAAGIGRAPGAARAGQSIGRRARTQPSAPTTKGMIKNMIVGADMSSQPSQQRVWLADGARAQSSSTARSRGPQCEPEPGPIPDYRKTWRAAPTRRSQSRTSPTCSASSPAA